jgi:hypothetical protein
VADLTVASSTSSFMYCPMKSEGPAEVDVPEMRRYIADSKLCSFENMDHIDRAGGRFVTVMPRSRQEDA